MCFVKASVLFFVFVSLPYNAIDYRYIVTKSKLQGNVIVSLCETRILSIERTLLSKCVGSSLRIDAVTTLPVLLQHAQYIQQISLINYSFTLP